MRNKRRSLIQLLPSLFKTNFSFFILLLLISTPFFFGCSARKPYIDQNEWYINYRNDLNNQKKYEELSFFLLVRDEDGIEDIEEIYLINDKREIFWRITDEVKIVRKEGKRAWIGTSRLIPEKGERFADGIYRIVIQDRAGASAEVTIKIPKDRLKPTDNIYPGANFKEGKFTLKGDRKLYQIWFYDENDNLLFRKETPPGVIDLDLMTGGEFSVRKPYYALVYSFIENRFAGVIVGPVYFYERSSPSFEPEDFPLPEGNI